MQRLHRSRAHRGIIRATIKRAEAQAIQIKVPQRDGNGDKKESECRDYTDQGHVQEGGGQQ